jgi:transcriptional regulator with XRE-family HTH domain
MIFPNLSWALTQRRMRQYQLAARADLSESALSRALAGRREFSAEERTRVAALLGFDVEWLFAEVPPAPGSRNSDASLPRSLRQ